MFHTVTMPNTRIPHHQPGSSIAALASTPTRQ
jgi:hypothetical protein